MKKEANKSQNEPLSRFEQNEVRYRPAPIWSRLMLLAISGSVFFGIVYAFVARIDEVVVTPGELQAFGAERPIKAPVSGVISEIAVKEGESVEKDQLLLKFDTRIFGARQESINAKVNSLRKSYEIEEKITNQITNLASEGAISTMDYLRQKNKLQEIHFSIVQLEASLRELRIEKSNVYLRSPLKGRVFNLIPSSAGYAAAIGETLLKVVPEGDLEAKIFINNSDIGFVYPKMKAQVRVDAYPFTQFGSIEGEIRSIGEEVLPADSQYSFSRFPAYIKLKKQYLELKGRKHHIRSGQSLSANIIVRDKPIISLLTDAVEKAFDSLRGIKSDQN